MIADSVSKQYIHVYYSKISILRIFENFHNFTLLNLTKAIMYDIIKHYITLKCCGISSLLQFWSLYSIAACRRQLDVVFMLDFSGSVETYYDQYVTFVRRVIHNLEMNFDRTRVGALTYGSHTTVQFDLRTYREKRELADAIRYSRSRPQGWTTKSSYSNIKCLSYSIVLYMY